MDSLFVCAKGNIVYWATKKNSSRAISDFGTLDISGLSTPDIQTKAELFAVWHLLSVKQVLGVNRTGYGVTIVMSTVANQKLLNRTTTADTKLFKYAEALQIRFAGAKIDVDLEHIWVDYEAKIESVEFFMPQVVVFNKKLGINIQITLHALERWHERTKSQNIARSFKKLAEVMSERNLYPINLAKDVYASKMKIYENVGEHYAAVLSQGIRVVLVPISENIKKLVTIYYAPPADCLY
jgi:hypothetical protein